jgi:hypothetical protein
MLEDLIQQQNPSIPSFSWVMTGFESISEALKFGVPSVALKLDWKLLSME